MKARSPMIFRLRWVLLTGLVLAIPAIAQAQGGFRAFTNPLTGSTETLGIAEIVGRVVQSLLGVAGVVAAIVIMIAGARILFAQGNEETITKGKQGLLWAVLGLAVAFGGFIIVDLLLSQSGAFFGQ